MVSPFENVDTTEAMDTRIGIGVIGMGWMGDVHARSFRLIPQRFPELKIDPDFIVCCDNVERRAQDALKRGGFARYTTDWRSVVDDPAVTVIVITTHNALHMEVAVAAAAAGKHIFCEKPVGRNSTETAAIAAAARESGVITGVGYNYRWAPVVRHALGLVQSGRLGTITHYRGRFLIGYARDPAGVLSWRFDREVAGGGAVADLMSHVVDMAHMLAGPIAQLVANTHTFIARRPLPTSGEGTHFSVGSSDGPTGSVTNEDYGAALVRFESGAQGTFEVCRVINGPKCQMAFEISGTNGTITWDYERMNELQLFLPDGTPERDGSLRIQGGPEHPFFANFNPGPGNSLSYEDLKVIEDAQFAGFVASGEQGQPGFEDALRVAEVFGAFDRSIESGCWEEVRPLQD